MFKFMDEDTLQRIVGPFGVADFFVQWLIGSDDLKRRSAGRAHGWGMPDDAPCPEWAFVALRGDGSVVRFRTNATNRRVLFCKLPGAYETQGPASEKRKGKLPAVVGSLAHGHLNLNFPNMLAGTRRCQCLAGTKPCGCQGRAWELLSSRMDIEDPDGASKLSIALNKKNETALKTSHTGIIETLRGVSLCQRAAVPSNRGDGA